MFNEPQAVTVNSVADSLPRISFAPKGVFYNATTGRKLSVTQIEGKRDRSTVRFDFTKTAADPLLDGVSRQYSESVYLVIDRPKVGFTPTETQHNAKAAVDWLAVAGNLTKVIGGES